MNTITAIWLHFRCRSFGGICKIGEFADTSTTFWKVRLQTFKWFSKRECIYNVLVIFSCSAIVCWILMRWIAFGSFPNFNSRRSRARALDAQTCMHMHTLAQTRTDKHTQAHTFTHVHTHTQAGVGELGIAYCDIDMHVNTLHFLCFFFQLFALPVPR